MENQPLVSCITATYGRYSLLRQAISCFLEQDYPKKELIILNNNSIPLYCDLPNIKIYNEPKYSTLGKCRKRLLEISGGEFIKVWDDDDLYLPWSLTQCVENVMLTNKKLFWKPTRSWYWENKKSIILTSNWFEASYIVHKSILQKYGFKDSGGDENLSWCDDGIQKKEGGIVTTEMDILSHYIYRFGHFTSHISAFLVIENVEERTRYWLNRNTDTGMEEPLKKIDLTPYWKQLYNDTKLTFDGNSINVLKNKFIKYGYNL
jgi:glycosyltransferase involved in cell wall biosynthesis